MVGTLSPDGYERWTALALTALTADLVGTMQGALSLATRYAGQREQFGAPIGSFQAVAHLCAEQAVSRGARSAMFYAAWCTDESPAEALDAARVAKAYAAEVARAVTEAAIQVHGGIGMTWECLAHLYLRRALLTGLCSATVISCWPAGRQRDGGQAMDFRDSPAEASSAAGCAPGSPRTFRRRADRGPGPRTDSGRSGTAPSTRAAGWGCRGPAPSAARNSARSTRRS